MNMQSREELLEKLVHRLEETIVRLEKENQELKSRPTQIPNNMPFPSPPPVPRPHWPYMPNDDNTWPNDKNWPFGNPNIID